MATHGPGNIAAHLRDRARTGKTGKVRGWRRPPVMVPHNPQEDEGEQKNEFTGDKGGWRGKKRVIRGGGKLGAAIGWLAGKLGVGGVVTPAAAGYVGHRAENLLTGDAAKDTAQNVRRSFARTQRVRQGPKKHDTWHMREQNPGVLRLGAQGAAKRTAIESTQNPEDILNGQTSRSTNADPRRGNRLYKMTHAKEHKAALAPHDEGNYEQAVRKLQRHGEMKTTKWSQRREMAGNTGRFTNLLKQVGLGKRSRAIRHASA